MKPQIKKSNTCIAVCKNRKGKLMIAGDRRNTWGYHHAETMEFPKINKKDGVLLGATGTGDACSLFVDDGAFNIPDKKVDCINTYMFHTFKPAVFKFLINQGYANKDKELSLPPDWFVEVVICIEGTTWTLIISNPLDTGVLAGHVDLSRISVPYATGCGGIPALAVLKHTLKIKGYCTQDDLKQALVIASEISIGCDDVIDILTED